MQKMTNNLSKELKKYYCEVGKFLSCSNKEKKNIIGSIKSSVECYVFDNPNSTFEDIIKHFGSPKDIAEEYYNNENAEKLIEKTKSHKKIVISIFAVIIVAFVFLIMLFIAQIHAGSGYISESKLNEVSQTDVSQNYYYNDISK